MVVVNGKIVLLDPTAKRVSSESSSFSIGKALERAIFDHNESLTSGQKEFKLSYGDLSAAKVSRKVMATVGRKLGAQKCIKKHIGRKSYRQIKKREPLFEFLLEKIIKEVNETHHLLSYTEGNWGVVKTVIQKLRNEKAHRRFARKKDSKGNRIEKSRKSSSRFQVTDRIGKISGKLKNKISVSSSVDENDAEQDINPKPTVSNMKNVRKKPNSHHLKHGKRTIRETLSLEEESDVDKNLCSDTDLEREKSPHYGKMAVRENPSHGSASRGNRCAVKDCKMKGRPCHECSACKTPVHNLCSQRIMGKAFKEGIFHCSKKCSKQNK